MRGESVRIAAMSAPAQTPFKAYLALGLGLLILGFSAIFIRWAEAPGPIVGFYRMAFGALVLAIPFANQLRQGKTTLSRRGILVAMLAGFFFGADVAAWASGVVLSGATLPTLFANTNPIWVGLGAWLLFREKIKPAFWLGLLLALLGAATILGLNASNGVLLDKGALLGLLAGFFYGIYFLVAQRGRQHLDALSFFWIGTLSSAITLLIINLVMGHPFSGYSPTTWLVFVVQGVLIQAAGWFLIAYAQGYLPASLVSPTLLGQPLLTAVLAGPLLGETLGRNDLLGGAAVLAGIFLVHSSRLQRKTKTVIASPQ